MTVCVPVAPLFRAPDASSEQVDEVLFGTSVTVTDSLLGFCRVVTDYGYTGYLAETDISQENAKPSMMIALPFADLLPDGRNFHKPVMTLPLGARVDAAFVGDCHGGTNDDRYGFVVLNDKRMFFIHKNALMPLPRRLENPAEMRVKLCENALRYLGAPYRWGGKTYAGIDCSGLAFMTYALAGVTLWRDAELDRSEVLHAISLEQAQAGDLLFFPGHVAVYLGDKRFLHAAAGIGSVSYGSLDPTSPVYHPWCAEHLQQVGTMFA